MFNLLKFEFKKMLNFRVTYITIIIGLLLFGAGLYAKYSTRVDNAVYESISNYIEKNPEKFEAGELKKLYEDGNNVSEFAKKYNIDLDKLKNDYIKEGVSFVKNLELISGGGYVLILSTLFTAMFVGSDVSSGYIKNIIGRNNYRTNAVFAKFIVSSAYTIIFLLLQLLASYISALILNADTSFDPHKLLKFTSVLILGLITVNSIIIMISNLFQKSNVTVTFSVLYSLGIVTAIIGLVEVLTKIKINDYLLYNAIQKLQYNMQEITRNTMHVVSVKEIIYSIIPYLVVSLFLAVLLLKKRDITTGE